MSRLDKLQPASFKGVSFLVRSESLSDGGRKIVLHDYPNSSQRYVEDLGQLPPRFKIEAFVQGDNWKERADALERVLNESGVGKLVMPTFGSISLYALPYVKDASQQSVGIISFRLDFASGKPANAPSSKLATTQDTFAKGDTARLAVQNAFEDIWTVPTTIDSILAAGADVVTMVNSAIDGVVGLIDTETISEMVKLATTVEDTVQTLIRDGENLANTIIQGTSSAQGLWQLISIGLGEGGNISKLIAMANYGEELLDYIEVTGSSIFGNGDDETSSNTPYWPETTVQRIARNTRRRATVRAQRINAMITAYEQAAVADYSTTDEIESARASIEEVYENIMLSGTSDKNALQSVQAVRSAVHDVRIASLEVLEQKEQQAFGTVTVSRVSPLSQFALAYNLYAEDYTDSELLTERARTVRSLNPNQNGIQITGSVEVLQSA